MVRESKIDGITLGLLLLILFLGWLNLYSVSAVDDPSIINFTTHHGKQAVFILFSLGLGALILFLDTKFVEITSYFVFGGAMVLLAAVLFVSKVSGASSWFQIGGIKIQPTEFAKVAVLMALAKYMSRFNFSFDRTQDFLSVGAAVVIPMILVLAQNDAGSAIVFSGIIFMLYREGLHPFFLVLLFLVVINGAISIIFSTTPLVNGYIVLFHVLAVAAAAVFLALRNQIQSIFVVLGVGVLMVCITLGVNYLVKPYQSARIRVLVASQEEIQEEESLKKVNYNLEESLVAIGSGGLAGKGYQQGTHTRGAFVPEEHTDFIFCVIGEEHGFIGTATVLLLFLLLLARIVYVAENSKSRYARVYGYGVASIIFMHVLVNVGMTIGLLPTIGIPLPFFSKGGSSMISFTLMIFVLMNLYSYRTNILT